MDNDKENIIDYPESAFWGEGLEMVVGGLVFDESARRNAKCLKPLGVAPSGKMQQKRRSTPNDLYHKL
jgi:hypothetical protein